MSISNNYPTTAPSLSLDFANTKQLDPRITFTRASTATFYNGVTTAKAEENLLIQSQTLNALGWGNQNTTTTANTEVAPDGTTTADTITGVAGTGLKHTNQSFSGVTGIYTVSFFAKAGTHSLVQVFFAGGTGPAFGGFANFDLSTGALGSFDAVGTPTITSVGNGWYRCTYSTTFLGAATSIVIALIDSTSAGRGASSTSTNSLFLWGAQLEQRSAVTAYTVTTTQPITNYVPVLQTAQNNVPRFEHNPITGESLGLEIEEQRTNLLLYSDDLANAAWNKSQTTVTSNTIVAPDGTLTCDKLVENTAAGVQHRIEQSISTTTNQSYTFTFYAKAGELSIFAVQIVAVGSSSSTSAIGFSIAAGVISPTSTSNGIVTSASSVAVGNGWYRCSLIYTLNGTVTSHQVRIFPRGVTNYTGDGYSGFYIWGAQLEAGSFPTSYIPTVASQVTRSADNASMTGTNFSSWYNAAEGTLYAEAVSLNAAGSLSQAVATISNSAGDSRVIIFRSTAPLPTVQVDVISGNQAALTGSGWANGSSLKISTSYKVNDFAVSFGGASVLTDTSGTLPVVDRLCIGDVVTTSRTLNGTIKKLAYYPARLTNAQLQALTGL